MTLGEIKHDAALRAGLAGPSGSDGFLLEADRLANDANIDVAADLELPQRLVQLDGHADSTLPFPTDMMEDGLISVMLNYKTSPCELEVLPVYEALQEHPWWMTENQSGTPQFVISDARNPTHEMKLIPTPNQAFDYAILYRVQPLKMVGENDLPLAVATLSGVVSALPNRAHCLVAIQLAILHLKNNVYQKDRTRETVDAHASKIKMLEADYASEKAKISTGLATNTITVANPMYRPRR